MKKFLVAGLAIMVSLALAAVALANHGQNVYTVKASTTSSTKAGSTKKPVNLGVKYGFTVASTEEERPAALKALKIRFAGIRFQTNAFKGCSAVKMQNAQSDDMCPKQSLMGVGYADNRAGAAQDRSQQAITCYLKLSFYNSRKNKAALFVESVNNTDSSRTDFCPIPVATAIPISIVKRASGDTMSFTIPDNLQNPGGTLKNSLIETQLSMPRKQRTIKRKKVAFLQSIGGCVRKKRAITTTFTHEDGITSQSAVAKCRK